MLIHEFLRNILFLRIKILRNSFFFNDKVYKSSKTYQIPVSIIMTIFFIIKLPFCKNTTACCGLIHFRTTLIICIGAIDDLCDKTLLASRNGPSYLDAITKAYIIRYAWPTMSIDNTPFCKKNKFSL